MNNIMTYHLIIVIKKITILYNYSDINTNNIIKYIYLYGIKDHLRSVSFYELNKRSILIYNIL
jgi:hypothetical protein